MTPSHLFVPPSRLPLHQRRAWRLVGLANGLAVPSAVGWSVVLALSGAKAAAAVYAALAVVAAATLWLLAHGRLRLAGRVTACVMLVFCLYNAIWLNAPMPGVPRSAHQYLLAMAVVSLLITRDDRPWLRLGLPAVALLAYASLAGTDFSLMQRLPVSPDTHRWGAWFDHVVTTGLVFATLHVLQSDVLRRSGAETELRDAILRDELELHYQPQVDEHGRVIGLEALVRWHHPRRGLVPPGDFIPMAEATGLIVPLGEWVMRHACQQLESWRSDRHLARLVLAVNVSAPQFERADFVPQVLGLLAQHRVEPARLKIELTESALAQDLPSVVAKMEALRRHGVQLALDDFGTGFSSLSALRRLPLDQLKIDQSFVRALGDSHHDEAIVRAVIGLGQTLGLDVIAEGVETAAHRDALWRLGCRHFQGYHFGRPVPAAQLRALFQAAPLLPTTVVVAAPAPAAPTPHAVTA